MDLSTRPNIVDIVIDLHSRGFTFDFSLTGNEFFCSQNEFRLKASDIDIREMYYFPRDTVHPCDKMVYAIEAPAYYMKGILIIIEEMHNCIYPEIIHNKLQEYIFKMQRVFINDML
jgi:hypothetical protein